MKELTKNYFDTKNDMKKGMRIAAAVMAAAFSMTVLAGCGKSETKTAETTAAASADNSSAAETTAASGEKKDLREVNVVLDWYPNAIHTFIYTAIERGYYAEEGLDVKVRFPANANDALALVAAGKAEIGMYYQQDVIQAVANQGTKIKSIGAIVQSPLSIAFFVLIREHLQSRPILSERQLDTAEQLSVSPL